MIVDCPVEHPSYGVFLPFSLFARGLLLDVGAALYSGQRYLRSDA